MSSDRPRDPFGILEGPAESEQHFIPLEEEETRLLGHLTDYFREAERARSPFEADWEYNNLMLIGQQMAVRRPYDNEVLRVVPERDSARRYSMDNQLRTTARAFVGKAIRIIPGVDVVPASTDREDIMSAEVLKSYLDWWFTRNDMRRKYKRAWEQIPTTGHAIWQLKWNRLGGEEIYWCPQCGLSAYEGTDGEPCVLCLMQGVESPMMRITTGGVEVDVLDEREFYPEPGVTEIINMQRCHTRIALPVAKIRELFPEKGMLVHEEDNLYKDRYLSYEGNLSRATLRTDFVSGYANLYTYFERPSGEYPDGLIVRMASDRVLSFGPNPYWRLLRRLPFYLFRGDRVPGCFYGEPVLNQQTALQREHNVLHTQLREWREHTVRPKLHMEARSGARGDRTDTSPGEIITTRPGTRPPDYIRLPNLPPYVINEVERLPRVIREKACLTAHDVGETTDSSGRAMALLAAQSNELFGPLIVENMPEWLAMHKDVLVLAQHLDPPDKRWSVTGKGRLTQYTWAMVQIKEGWDVMAADEDSLSRNPELRRQQALDMLGQGVYTDPRTGMPDMRRFMRDAGMKEQPGAGIDPQTAEHTHAWLIPEMIAQGVPVQPQLFDDANIHARELLNWLRGPGRAAPGHIVQQVLVLWMRYAMAAMPAPDMQNFMPNPGMLQNVMGGGGPGGGGGPPVPGGGPPGQKPRQLSGVSTGALPQSSGQGPARMVHNADRAGERAAIGNRKHEG